MQPSLDFLAILNFLGAAQGALLAFALLGLKRGDRFANRILAALTMSVSIVVCGAVLLTSKYVFAFPHLSRIHHPFAFLVGPLLFLYLRALTSGERAFKRRDFLHFIPFVLCVLFLIPYYFQSGADKLEILTAEHASGSAGEWYYFRSALFIVQFLTYLILAVAMLVRYAKKTDPALPRSKYVLFQLRFFVAFTAVLWVGAVVRVFLADGGATNLLVPFGISIFIYALCYLGLSKPEVFARHEDAPVPKKYEKSTLLPQWSDRYLNKLLAAMENEKPYLDGDLTLQKLAADLSIPPTHLSQIINERLGQTFVDFINAHRIEEAKKKLIDPNLKHHTVLAVGEAAGFNSKSTFNAVFKKHTSMTPSEYRKSANGHPTSSVTANG